MQEVHTISVCTRWTRMCILALALALAQTYSDHCPTFCWTNNHFIVALYVYISYCSQWVDVGSIFYSRQMTIFKTLLLINMHVTFGNYNSRLNLESRVQSRVQSPGFVLSPNRVFLSVHWTTMNLKAYTCTHGLFHSVTQPGPSVSLWLVLSISHGLLWPTLDETTAEVQIFWPQRMQREYKVNSVFPFPFHCHQWIVSQIIDILGIRMCNFVFSIQAAMGPPRHYLWPPSPSQIKFLWLNQLKWTRWSLIPQTLHTLSTLPSVCTPHRN